MADQCSRSFLCFYLVIIVITIMIISTVGRFLCLGCTPFTLQFTFDFLYLFLIYFCFIYSYYPKCIYSCILDSCISVEKKVRISSTCFQNSSSTMFRDDIRFIGPNHPFLQNNQTQQRNKQKTMNKK